MNNETRASSTPDAREILRVRARALARPRERAPVAETSLELLEFRLARECYALETRHVREAVPLKDLTPLPCTPPFVLALARRLAELHGGTLEVASEPGTGSTFTLRVPIREKS